MSVNYPPASFIRRFAALIYDLLLAASIVVIAHLLLSVALIIIAQSDALNLEQYKEGLVGFLATYRSAHLLFLASAVAIFFMWFWTHGGQTLGMKAWRLRIQNDDGTPIHPRQAVVRVCFALGGLGNLLILADWQNKRALQDRLSDSIVVTLPKGENGPLKRR
ncbi:RDD family protein [Neiella sp. HB171785]|uniref:RDD family protein n=1 Tax=Neiella litorisoli TaxID=2771431 RepID=A0A8J6UIU5_9GAMM|nr:RDD family protein [Neiella litorisoli]MBD1389118.1 RDD family protein [Neiella litorisoli]